MNEDLTVVWNGSFKDTYLCVYPVQVRDFSHVKPTMIPKGRPKLEILREDHRPRLLGLLAERDLWPSAALFGELRISNGDYYRLLTQLATEGLIEWKHGWVALTPKEAA